MLLVLARERDALAAEVARRCGPGAAMVITPSDLAVSGWRHYVGGPPIAGPPAAVIDGHTLHSDQIEGVLTRLSHVSERDVRHVARADRAYVAAEMTAFLRGWLTDLPCPVINRPTPTCLAGPDWRAEQWIVAASRLGIPVVPMHRQVTYSNVDAPPLGAADATEVLIGERCLGTANDALRDHTRRLARSVGVELLSVRFANARVVSASAWPDLGSPEVLEAVVERLLACARGRRKAA